MPKLELGTPAWERLRGRLVALLAPSGLKALAVAALDRRQAEKLSKGATADSGKEELVGTVVDRALHDERLLLDLVRELDQACQRESSLVASLAPHEVADKIGHHQALAFRRQGARLVWAFFRDERPEVATAAEPLIGSYGRQQADLLAVSARLRESGGAAELVTLESAYRSATTALMHMEDEISSAGREHARLAEEIARRDAELQRAKAERERLSHELQRARAAADAAAAATGGAGAAASGGAGVAGERSPKGPLAAKDASSANAGNANPSGANPSPANPSSASDATALPGREQVTATQDASPPPLVESPGHHLARQRHHGPGVRVGVFLDVANLSGAARRLYGGSIDFRQLLQLAIGSRRLVEARAYVIDKGKEGFDSFARAMRAAGFRVAVKKPKVFPDGTMKADWDVTITVEALGSADKLDVLVLGSGDGDFLPLVSALKQRGLRVEVMAFTDRSGAELLRAAHQVIELDGSVLQR